MQHINRIDKAHQALLVIMTLKQDIKYDVCQDCKNKSSQK